MAERTAGSLDAEFVPARGALVYSVEIDGELVLLDEHEDRLHHLNPTASLLWSCFDGEAPCAGPGARHQRRARPARTSWSSPTRCASSASSAPRDSSTVSRPTSGPTRSRNDHRNDREPHPASARRALAAFARRGRAAAARRRRRDHPGRHRSGGLAAARRVAVRGRAGRGARGRLRLDPGRRGPRPRAPCSARSRPPGRWSRPRTVAVGTAE